MGEAYPSYAGFASGSPPSSLYPNLSGEHATASHSGSSGEHYDNGGPIMRKSCQHCRKRKIRCIPSDADEAVCKACNNKGQPCIFERQSVMGRPPKNKKGDSEEAPSQSLSAQLARSQNGTDDDHKPRKKQRVHKDPSPTYSARPPPPIEHQRRFSSYDGLLPPIHSYIPQPPEYSWRTQTLEHRPEAFYAQQLYTGYPTSLASYRAPSPTDLRLAYRNSPAYPPHAVLAPIMTPPEIKPVVPQSTRVSRPRTVQVSARDLQQIQSQDSLYEHFKHYTLQAVLSTFLQLYTPSQDLNASPGPLMDPAVPMVAKIRTLSARAVAYRKAYGMKTTPSSADYARRLISPLWDGLPVDIIALTTTGRPSASGPFSLSSEAPEDTIVNQANEEYLFVKLLREDESSHFAISEIHEGPNHTRQSPYLQYAPNKAAIAKYFDGYYANHPLAPLVINDKLFLEDLANNPDDILLNVIVGSALARAPCLGGTGGDARDVGEYFYEYIQDQLLSRPLEQCLSLATCQALLLWGTHELAHMRIRRTVSLWATAEVLLRERIRRFQEKAVNDMRRQSTASLDQAAPTSSLSWRDIVEQELTVNALWIIVIFGCWGSLSMRLPHNTLGVLANGVPSPPVSVTASASFAYTSSGLDNAVARQHVARRIIDRFSSITQLMTSIITIKSQAQAKSLFAPDPARPLATVEEPQVATWLLEMASYLGNSASPPSTSDAVAPVATSGSDSQNGFLVAAHAVLALHQLLPYAPSKGEEYGSPVPVPTIESSRTALQALYVLSKSIATNTAHGRTRTQALLLDAMPRVLSLLEIFRSTSLCSIEHFSLVTSHRDMIHELLSGLTQACSALERSSPGGGTEASMRAALERSQLQLGAIADTGNQIAPLPQVAATTFKSGRRSPSLADLVDDFGYPQIEAQQSSGSSSRADSWQLFDSEVGQSASPALHQPLEAYNELGYNAELGAQEGLHSYMPAHQPYTFDFSTSA